MTVRERSRDAFRLELAQAAVNVLAARGFEQVTVEDLAQHLGISRATFFRYFGSKDDVVVAVVQNPDLAYAAALREAPYDRDTSAWVLLRAAFEPAVTQSERDPVRLRARLRMISGLPGLRARIAEKRLHQVADVSHALAERTGEEDTARTLTVAAFAAVDLAWERWASTEQASFRVVLDRTFRDLRQA